MDKRELANRALMVGDIKRLVDTLADSDPAPALYVSILDGQHHWAKGPDIGEYVQRIAIEHGAAFIELKPPTTPDTPRFNEYFPVQIRIGYGLITATVYGYFKYASILPEQP
jgi:hypothetical protein